MSRCISCNRVLSVSDFKFKHKETGEHDGFCTGCRTSSFDVTPIREYVCGVITESLVKRVESGETLTVAESPNFYDDNEDK